MAVYKTHKATVDVNDNLVVQKLPLVATNSDTQADKWEITVNGMSLTGKTCSAQFIRRNMSGASDTVVINNGTIDGNVASIILPPACYVYYGQFQLTISINDANNVSRAIYVCTGTILKSNTEDNVDPGTAIPSIPEIIRLLNEGATSAANSAADALEVKNTLEQFIVDNPGSIVIDPTLSIEGAAADAKTVGNKIDETIKIIDEDIEIIDSEKLGVADYSAAAAVGTADNLIDRKANGTERRPFGFDTSCGDASIEDDGTAEIRSIHGKTLVWNQLNNNNGTTGTNNGITFTKNNDGSWSIVGTVEDDGNNPFRNLRYAAGEYFLTEGHKYYLGGSIDENVGVTLYRGSVSVGYGYGQERIVTAPAQDGNYDILRFTVRKTYTGNINTICHPVCIDLTMMFGAGNEPSTVDEFKRLFPEIPTTYNAGELANFCAEGIKTVGFNIFNPANAQYGKSYHGNTGALIDATNSYASGYMRVLPNTQYYAKDISANIHHYFFFYDARKNFIGRTTGNTNTNQAFTTPSNCAYVAIGLFQETSSGDTGTADYTNLCVHLVWSGYRNGDYEPYWSQTRALDLTAFGGAMKSAGTAYDEKDFVRRKNVKRVGIVDMGTLNWSGTTTANMYQAVISGMKSADTNAMRLDGVISEKYPVDTVADLGTGMTDRTMKRRNDHMIVVRDSNYPTAQALKNSLDGVYLAYELDTPVETDIPDTEANTYRVADFGTEEIVAPNGEISTPFTGVIAYSTDFTRQIATMNKNYQSQDSMGMLLMKLKELLGLSALTKTWNESAGYWTYNHLGKTIDERLDGTPTELGNQITVNSSASDYIDILEAHCLYKNGVCQVAITYDVSSQHSFDSSNQVLFYLPVEAVDRGYCTDGMNYFSVGGTDPGETSIKRRCINLVGRILHDTSNVGMGHISFTFFGKPIEGGI